MKSPPLVYFVTAASVDTFPVKVGRSTIYSFASRVKDLQTAIPYQIEVLFLMLGGSAQERNIHQAFADHRMKGEWFNRTPEFMGVVSDMQQRFPDWQDLHPLGRARAARN